MAKYIVIHNCGHEQVHVLFGKGKDRQRKIAWLESIICDECQKKEYDEENAKNAAANKAAGLPKLSGTPKQIAWAETIRKKKIDSLNAFLNKINEAKNQFKQPEHYQTCINIINQVINETNSSYWIDNKDQKFDFYWLNEEFEKSIDS